ncbi:MAG TPA: class I SAM-dependent methyltransferase [Thermoanaerobaculia bacterium]
MDQSVGAGVYAGRIARTLNNGFTALMISVGHRTGLFDVMAALPPSTTEQIARAAGLAERHVREWLAAMTSALVVDHDPRTATYYLPIEYAAVLTRNAGTNSLAPAAQLLSLLAGVEDLVVTAFHTGGGVMPEAYERMNELMSDERREVIDESYVDAILEVIPGLRMHLDLGAKVLDAGCGDGALLAVMARMFPRSTFRGYDLSHAAIRRAGERAAEGELRNVEFAVGDVASLDEPRTYDLVLAFDTMHEQSYPRLVLRKIAASLKRHGIFVMQEVAVSSHLSRAVEHPFAPMLFALSTMHSVPVALSHEGEALGRMWGRERAAKLLAEAGFRNVRFETLGADSISYFAVASR